MWVPAYDITGARTTNRAILDMQLCACIKLPLSCTVYNTFSTTGHCDQIKANSFVSK